jgi:sterol carrier protein 2
MPAATSTDGFKSKEIFDNISASLADDGKTLVGKVKGIYGFKVKGGPGGSEGFWIVDAKNGCGSVEFNGKGKLPSIGWGILNQLQNAAKPDVTLTISDGDLVDLMTGKLNSQKAFFQGKLKVCDGECWYN